MKNATRSSSRRRVPARRTAKSLVSTKAKSKTTVSAKPRTAATTKPKHQVKIGLWKLFVVIAVIASIPLLAVARGDNKAAQCNKLIAVVNKAANEAITASKSNNPDKVGELQKASENANQYAKELATVEVKDETLKQLQSRFVQMYQDRGKAGLDLVEAARKKDMASVSNASNVLQNATARETPLVDEFNQYCKASK